LGVEGGGVNARPRAGPNKKQKNRQSNKTNEKTKQKLTPSVSHIRKMRSKALTQGVVNLPVAASSKGAFGYKTHLAAW
jgi:hypothetical protein